MMYDFPVENRSVATVEVPFSTVTFKTTQSLIKELLQSVFLYNRTYNLFLNSHSNLEIMYINLGFK